MPEEGKVGGSRFGSHRLPPQVAGLWTCPTCRSENPGTIADGCQNPECPTVQAPPAKVALPTPRKAQPVPGDEVAEAYQSWRAATGSAPVNIVMAFKAGWRAGLLWSAAQVRQDAAERAEASAEPESEPPPVEEPAVLLIDDHGIWGPTKIDETTRNTILAALRFYEENDLRYGSKPGQLSSAQVKALVEKLSPEEAQ